MFTSSGLGHVHTDQRLLDFESLRAPVPNSCVARRAVLLPLCVQQRTIRCQKAKRCKVMVALRTRHTSCVNSLCANHVRSGADTAWNLSTDVELDATSGHTAHGQRAFVGGACCRSGRSRSKTMATC
eukprot:6181706-Pleurochrysis_carterae.AAC.1